MNDRDSALGNLFDAAVALANGGVNLDQASETVQDTLTALGKQAKALKDTDYSGAVARKTKCPHCKQVFKITVSDVAALSKTMANTAKVLDETARLIQYTNGKPDRRTEVQGMDWLQALSPEQLAIVQGWMTERPHARSADA